MKHRMDDDVGCFQVVVTGFIVSALVYGVWWFV